MILPASAIIARHRTLPWSEPPGEWGEIQTSTRLAFRRVLDAGNEAMLDMAMATVFEQPALIAGMVSYDPNMPAEQAETLTAWMRTNHDLWLGYLDHPDPRLLEAPRHGNPVRFDVDGTRMLYDTPRHDANAYRLARRGPTVVVEFGGGYGGFAHQLLQRHRCTVVLVDLPASLYVSWWWLVGCGHTVKWWDEEWPWDADVVLVPDFALADFDPALDPDACVSFHALGEMGPDTVGRYLHWMDEHRVPLFYHENAHCRPAAASPDALCVNYPEVLAGDYPLANYREVWRAPAPWPGTGFRYWEFLYERVV